MLRCECSVEENWLFEAITECYIPLIEVFCGLLRDGVDFRITLSFTPCLSAMLADPLLQDALCALPGQPDSVG